VLVLTVALIAGVAAGYALGGRLHNLENLRLRLAWLVLVALGVQIVIYSPLGAPLGEHAIVALHLASYAMLIAFAALNARRTGIAIAGVGIAVNAVVIGANGGYMPTTARALTFAGMNVDRTVHNNSMLDDGMRLLPLGDIMAVPHWVPLVANVFSIGDVLIAVGVAVLLATAMRAPAERPAAKRFALGGEPEAR